MYRRFAGDKTRPFYRKCKLPPLPYQGRAVPQIETSPSALLGLSPMFRHIVCAIGAPPRTLVSGKSAATVLACAEVCARSPTVSRRPRIFVLNFHHSGSLVCGEGGEPYNS